MSILTGAAPAIYLGAYLNRIGYRGERAPTLAALQALHLQHTLAIAFENLNPFLGLPVALDLSSLERKLVQDRRGGYCFEQNLLFAAALRALGFAASGLSARVVWGQGADAITARSHMLLRVDLPDGPHIADVGFGGQTLTGPIKLAPGVAQETPHERFRLIAAGDEFILESEIAGEWKPLYRFDLRPSFDIDYDIANYYLSTHPQSHFVVGLTAARPTPDGRWALRDDALAFHRRDGVTERRRLTTVDETREALQTIFGLDLATATGFEAAVARMLAR